MDFKNKLEQLVGQVSLYVEFLNTDETVEYNTDVQFWAASVITIPIACTLFKQDHDLSKKLKIKEENYVLGSGILKLLNRVNEYTLNDLLILMIVSSDNTATNELIDLIGWENVEVYMKELGLENTTFKHKMMIKAGRGPNLTTTKDMGKLLKLLYEEKIPGATNILNLMNEHIDRSRIPAFIPNDIKIAHKDGSLEDAMHDVGIIYSENPFIFCFMSDDQKDKQKTRTVLSSCAKDCLITE